MSQIVRCFPSTISTQIFYDALQHFNDMSKCQLLPKKNQLYCLLVNAFVTGKWLEKCENHVYYTLFQRIDTEEFPELPLVLLASKSMPLTRAYVSYLNRQSDLNAFEKRTAFLLATQRKMHFFENVATDELDITEPNSIASVIQLVKIAVMIENTHTKITDVNRYDDIFKYFVSNIDPGKLSDNQMIIYNEFQRIISLYQYVRNDPFYEFQRDAITIRMFTSKYNILDFFCKFNDGCIISATNDYSAIRRQLITNQMFNQLIDSEATKCYTKISELHLYDQFYAIYLLNEVLLMKPYAKNYDEIIRIKCIDIKQVIDGIDDTIAFVETIESLFTLLFMRWDHTKIDSNGKLDSFPSMTTLDETDTSNDGNDHDIKKQQQKTILRNGFICSFTVLKNMLNILSSTMANHKIDEQNENIKQRFMDVGEVIASAKWKLLLIDSYYLAVTCIQLPKNLKNLLTPRYRLFETRMIYSSDDDDTSSATSTKNLSILRRKPRRRLSLRKSNQIENKNNESFANSTEIGKKPSAFDCSNVSVIQYNNIRDRYGFMNKMLGTFCDMVAICISKKDFDEAKRIIEVMFPSIFCSLNGLNFVCSIINILFR